MALGCSGIFLIVVGLPLVILGVVFPNIVVVVIGIIALLLAGLCWWSVIKDRKELKKREEEHIKWLNSPLDRDRICFDSIEPVYIKYARHIVAVDFKKHYKEVVEQDIVYHTSGSSSVSGGMNIPSNYVNGQRVSGGYAPISGTSFNSQTTVAEGNYTKEYIEAVNELCRKYKSLFCNDDEELKAEIYGIFDGCLNKDFEKVIVDYIDGEMKLLK